MSGCWLPVPVVVFAVCWGMAGEYKLGVVTASRKLAIGVAGGVWLSEH